MYSRSLSAGILDKSIYRPCGAYGSQRYSSAGIGRFDFTGLTLEWPIRVPQTQSTFHPHAQQNVFRHRGVCRNEDHSPAMIHSCDTAPTPTGFAEIVGDQLPI